VLRSAVVPRSGLPPYARVGNWPVILFCLALVTAGVRLRRRLGRQ
jgi:apolipoprotein N-acyltransferase